MVCNKTAITILTHLIQLLNKQRSKTWRTITHIKPLSRCCYVWITIMLLNSVMGKGSQDFTVFCCLYFKVSKCPKYAIASLHLQAQVNCLLSPRLAHSLTWNRYVNHQGKVAPNFPMDLDVEHDNKVFKADIHSFKGEITNKSIARVGQATEPTDVILSAFDQSTHVRKPSGKHTTTTTWEVGFQNL